MLKGIGPTRNKGQTIYEMYCMYLSQSCKTGLRECRQNKQLM